MVCSYVQLQGWHASYQLFFYVMCGEPAESCRTEPPPGCCFQGWTLAPSVFPSLQKNPVLTAAHKMTWQKSLGRFTVFSVFHQSLTETIYIGQSFLTMHSTRTDFSIEKENIKLQHFSGLFLFLQNNKSFSPYQVQKVAFFSELTHGILFL